MFYLQPYPVSQILAGAYTIATLPDPTANVRKYAWASDLFGGPGDYCISDGTNWKPVRPLAVLSIANSNADQQFTALVHPPTIVFQGALTALRTMTFSTQYAYSGAKFRFKREATGLFGLSVLGSVISLNSWMDVEYNGTSWIQTASGGLL